MHSAGVPFYRDMRGPTASVAESKALERLTELPFVVK